MPLNWSIETILKETKNWPDFDFFVQAGGGASGEILLPRELKQQVPGQGAIIVFNQKKTDPFSLMKEWVDFFLQENCDKCVPCREGVYRLAEMLEKIILLFILFCHAGNPLTQQESLCRFQWIGNHCFLAINNLSSVQISLYSVYTLTS